MTAKGANLRSVKRFARLAGVVVAITCVVAPAASAHPLGNFTVNRYSGLEIAPDEVVIRYALDVAEVPTFQELTRIDGDHDGTASRGELSSYAISKASFVLEGLQLFADGRRLTLHSAGADAELRMGQGGLRVLRLEAGFVASLPPGASQIEYRDANFTGIPGWKEISAIGVRGEGVKTSTVPLRSISDALRAYPASLLKHPPADAAASIRIGPGPNLVAPSTRTSDERRVATTRLLGSRFASLIERDLTAASILVALLLAFAFGTMHALGPGHGKTVMAAYLAGAHGGVRDAAVLGLAVSLMHTLSVIALGAATVVLTNLFSPAAIYPWLTLASGAIITVFGALLLARRVRRAGDHAHASSRELLTRRGLTAIALSGGLVPSPTAVVVLLGAVALRRVAFGVALVGAFSAGLAVALAVVGVMILRARAFAASRWETADRSIVPVLSSCVILTIGIFLTVRAALALA